MAALRFVRHQRTLKNMCGRYVIAKATADLADAAGADWVAETLWQPSYNIAPTTSVPVLVERAEADGELKRELHLAHWGLIPPWAKDTKVGARAFNARSETVTEKPTFKKPILSQRCALVADGYYEWEKDSAGNKTPHYVHPTNSGAEGEGLIFFAGIYQWWKTPEGKWLLSASMLTMDSPAPEDPDPTLAKLARLHHRIPIALDPAQLDHWIQPQDLSTEEAQGLVASAAEHCFDIAKTWHVEPVGKAVGNVRNNSPELIIPVR